jgi:pyridoxine 5-phosphate synthase
MTKLSVNINKFATLRNARGGNVPDVIQAARDCERLGAQGITVHPRPDERHIRYADVMELKEVVTTEFNIEGYPNEKFLQLMKTVKPTQCTLVPDPPGALTSDHGWDSIKHKDFLIAVVNEIKGYGIRVSMFIDPIEQFIEGAKITGADRIELYTGPYAHMYSDNKEKAIEPYVQAAKYAQSIGLGINAGHDLSLENLRYMKENIPFMDEVSIGHALICDAIYYGLEKTIGMYLERLK